MTTPLLPFQDGAWRGLHTETMPVPEGGLGQWLDTLAPFLKYPSRRIFRCDTPAGAAFAKVLDGVGDTPHAPWPALKWLLRPSRAFHILDISRQMQAAGIHCAEVLLAARKRAFPLLGWPTDLIITRAVPGTSLRILLRDNPDDATASLALTIDALARFHAAGFSHGDCNPGNLYLEAATRRVHFIDNDRTIAVPPKNAFRKNLQQLGFHLLRLRLIQPRQWTEALRHYADLAGWDARDTCRNLRVINDAIDRRLRLEPPPPPKPPAECPAPRKADLQSGRA